jgi:hypothetical protein
VKGNVVGNLAGGTERALPYVETPATARRTCLPGLDPGVFSKDHP